jgi:hypothetical protein
MYLFNYSMICTPCDDRVHASCSQSLMPPKGRPKHSQGARLLNRLAMHHKSSLRGDICSSRDARGHSLIGPTTVSQPPHPSTSISDGGGLGGCSTSY